MSKEPNSLNFIKAGNIKREELYGQDAWEALGDLSRVPSPSTEFWRAWEGPCPILNRANKADGLKMKETHRAIYIPETVNGAPLTINNIEKLFKSDGLGSNKIGYAYIWDKIRKQFGEEPFKGGYWFAMLKSSLEGTDGKSYAEQLKILEKCSKEYEVPSVIEAILFCLMPYIASGEKKEYILGQSPWKFTRCKETIGDWRVVVGGLTPSGLLLFLNDIDFAYVCIVPSRKF